MDSTYNPDTSAIPAQPTPSTMPTPQSPESYQTTPPAPNLTQPQTETTPDLTAALNQAARSNEAENGVKSYTSFIQMASGLMAASAHEPDLQKSIDASIKKVTEESLKEALTPKEKQT